MLDRQINNKDIIRWPFKHADGPPDQAAARPVISASFPYSIYASTTLGML